MVSERKVVMGQRGMIHVYCGDGKGKTSAALGLMIRAAGRGKKILFVRFLKNDDSGELAVLEQISSICQLRMPKVPGFYWTMTKDQKEELKRAYTRVWESIEEQAGEFDVLVMDEFTSTFRYGLIPNERLLSFLGKEGERPEIILTGRDPDGRVLEMADYISEIKAVRHPFEQGIPAREGIEY